MFKDGESKHMNGRNGVDRKQSGCVQRQRDCSGGGYRLSGVNLEDGPGVPKANVNRKCEHGVILKVITTNICGSDQHMVRGRTTAPEGLVLGHEITGEVIETGRDVEFIKKEISYPFLSILPADAV